MSARHYKTLGLPPEADLAQIKKAYRQLAKQWHPDRNSAPGAETRFIAISEAYEQLVAIKSGRLRSTATRSRRRSAPRQETSGQREARIRQESRERAQAHARMRFEAYKKTEQYQDSLALETAVHFAKLLLTILFYILLPIILYSTTGPVGLIIQLVLCFFFLPAFFDVFRHPNKYLQFDGLGEALGRVMYFEGFQVTSSLLVNGLIFWVIGLGTLMPLGTQASIMAQLALLGLLLSFIPRLKKLRPSLILGFGPFLFTGMLLVNYLGSHSPRVEDYAYKQIVRKTSSGSKERDVLITLENDTYAPYAGVRFFMAQDEVGRARHIRYTMADGLLGIQVMRDYELY